MPTMLPSLPKTFGTLKHVFSSAAQAILAKGNYFNLSNAKSGCVILVDGLGFINLREKQGHAPFLNGQRSKSISCGFPSTTATSITSFATAKDAGEHGLIGYKMFDEESNSAVNLLTDLTASEGDFWFRKYQLEPDTSSTEGGLKVHVVSLAEYENSGFTAATMSNVKFHSAKQISERFETALRILQTGKANLIYLYVPELDQAAHRYGVGSRNWLELLELLDSEMRRFATALPAECGALLTADHGVVDVTREDHVYLDEHQIPGLLNVSGDPRAAFIYTRADNVSKIATDLQGEIGDSVAVLTREDVISSGLYPNLKPEVKQRLPQIFVLALKKVAIYHREFAKPKSLNMIGQHGSISEEELLVPLLRFGVWAS